MCIEPPLPLGIAADAPGQLGHHAPGVHAAGEHVAVVAIGGRGLVALLGRGHHADDHRLLPDIEMAEAADQPHAVELAGLLLEAADDQHVAIGLAQQRRVGLGGGLAARAAARGGLRRALRGGRAGAAGRHRGSPSLNAAAFAPLAFARGGAAASTLFIAMAGAR
jgi:hypothetical protein